MNPTLRQYTKHREKVLDRVRRLLIEKLGVQREPDEIDPDTPLFGSGLGLDSIDAVELVVNLEENHLGVRLANDIVGRAEMRTVNTIVDLILAREGAARGDR